MKNDSKTQKRIAEQAQALTTLVLPPPSIPKPRPTYDEWLAEQVRRGSKLDRLFGSVHPSMRGH
jgi:hypothetical protein